MPRGAVLCTSPADWPPPNAPRSCAKEVGVCYLWVGLGWLGGLGPPHWGDLKGGGGGKIGIWGFTDWVSEWRRVRVGMYVWGFQVWDESATNEKAGVGWGRTRVN